MKEGQIEKIPGTPARLIPIAGMKGDQEQEQRATSALLAVLQIVDDFAARITKPLGAPKAKLQTWTECDFKLADGKSVRPDGVIQASRGKRKWTALVEVKTGSNRLRKEQIEDYLLLAREQGFDCVLTISNEFILLPGTHPVEVDRRKLKSVDLHHLSWAAILTHAITLESFHRIGDPEQAWILNELIRFLASEKSGTHEFSDMGANWITVRDASRRGTLRAGSKDAESIARKWEELMTFASLKFRRIVDSSVDQVHSSQERKDVQLRVSNLMNTLVAEGKLEGCLRIRDAAGDLRVLANLGSRQIRCAVRIDAPRTGRNLTRINWLLRQLEDAPADTIVSSWGLRSRDPKRELLSNVKAKQSLLIPDGDREIVSFSVSSISKMGPARSGTKAFSTSVIASLEKFYREIVQSLRAWQAPTPKMRRGDDLEIAPQESGRASDTRVSTELHTPDADLITRPVDSDAN